MHKQLKHTPCMVSGVLLFVCITGCAKQYREANISNQAPVPRGAMIAIGAIYNASNMFLNDYGVYPGSVNVLEEKAYLAIDPEVKRQWRFEIIGTQDKINQIRAISTEMMMDRAGHIVTYDIETGRFSGYGFNSD